MLLSLADGHAKVSEKLVRVFPERRDPARIAHRLVDLIRARIFAIACGYEDGNDLDQLRSDPAFKLACGRLPDSGLDLCSPPTLSRLENAPDLRETMRRGLPRPKFLIVDGIPGLEAAIAVVWDGVPVQRCTVHKHRNLLAHRPNGCTRRSRPTTTT